MEGEGWKEEWRRGCTARGAARSGRSRRTRPLTRHLQPGGTRRLPRRRPGRPGDHGERSDGLAAGGWRPSTTAAASTRAESGSAGSGGRSGSGSVHRLEAGRSGVYLTTLWRVAVGLDVYPADLVAEPGNSRLDPAEAR